MKISTTLATQFRRAGLSKDAPHAQTSLSNSKTLEGEFRPPWVYMGMRVISFAVIPSTLRFTLTLLIDG